MSVKGVPRAVVSPAPLTGKWTETGATLSRITVYPLKSGMGIDVKEAEVTKHGLRLPELGGARDREFIAVEENESRTKATMLTSRRHPSMQLVEARTEVAQGGRRVLKLMAPGMEDFQMELDKSKMERNVSLEIWESGCHGLDLGDSAGDWLREYVFGAEESGRRVRLLWHQERETSRQSFGLEKEPGFPAWVPDALPLFVDMTPYLAVSEESARRIAEEVTAANPTSDAAEDEEYFRRFRPNMLVSGVKEPFAEDYWQYFRIGGDESSSAVIRSMCLCQRCEMTTVDPRTGTKTRGGEPLKTLRTFRLPSDPAEKDVLGSHPMVGNQAAMERPGRIVLGDRIWAQIR